MTFLLTKKFINGLELEFSMKGKILMEMILMLIGVLGMVPTGYAGRCSRVLKARVVS